MKVAPAASANTAGTKGLDELSAPPEVSRMGEMDCG